MPFHSIVTWVAALPLMVQAGENTGGVAIGSATSTASPSTVTVGRVVTLDDAIRFTREGHLSLRAAGFASGAALARTRDSGRLPNPTLAATLENMGGSLGSNRGETSLLIEQALELGGDRTARAGLAGALATVSRVQEAHLERILEAETVKRFCDAWVLQERVQRLREAERIADVAVEAAEARLKAGAAPAFERTRALSFRSLREIERRRDESELEVARRRLAFQWSAEAVAFDSLGLPEPVAPTLPSLDELLSRLEGHPGLRRAAAESAAEGWRVREARAARVPDLQVGAGVRHLAEVDGTGFAVGLSLPLPLWNARRGPVVAAEAELAGATARERQIALEVRGELRSAYGRFLAAVSTWQGIRDRVRPAAEEALRLIVAGYRSGRLGYLEIQEGQRSLLEADVLLIDASADVWRARGALEGLVGVRLDALAPGKEER